VRLLITIPDLATDSGGPSLSALRTAEHAAAQGAEVAVAFAEDGRPRLPAPGNIRLFPITAGSQSLLTRSLAHYRGLGTAMTQFSPDVVYDFGVWLPQNAASFRAAANRHLPWICSARGMLEPWSRSSKSLKKALAWHLYQRRILQRAYALVATSPEERNNLQNLLPQSQIWLVPNGVDLPPLDAAKPTTPLRQALFLSRLDPKKQPDLLIRAWAKVRPAGWRLVIAGPGSGEYRRFLQQLINEQGAGTHIELRDAAFDLEKEKLFRESQLFVLPTFSENFGIVIAEALAYGLPVITTTGTPWSRIKQDGCGWYVEPAEPSVTEALRTACALTPAALSALGRNGRRLAQDYSWASTARSLLEHCTPLSGRPGPQR